MLNNVCLKSISPNISWDITTLKHSPWFICNSNLAGWSVCYLVTLHGNKGLEHGPESGLWCSELMFSPEASKKLQGSGESMIKKSTDPDPWLWLRDPLSSTTYDKGLTRERKSWVEGGGHAWDSGCRNTSQDEAGELTSESPLGSGLEEWIWKGSWAFACFVFYVVIWLLNHVQFFATP